MITFISFWKAIKILLLVTNNLGSPEKMNLQMATSFSVEVELEGDRAIGRGACDMKAFDAIAINLLRAAAESGGLEAPLAVLLTCKERPKSRMPKQRTKHPCT